MTRRLIAALVVVCCVASAAAPAAAQPSPAQGGAPTSPNTQGPKQAGDAAPKGGDAKEATDADAKPQGEEPQTEFKVLPEEQELQRWYDAFSEGLETFFVRDERDIGLNTVSSLMVVGTQVQSWFRALWTDALKSPLDTGLKLLPVLVWLMVALGAGVGFYVQARRWTQLALTRLDERVSKPPLQLLARWVLHLAFYVTPPSAVQLVVFMGAPSVLGVGSPWTEIAKGLGWLAIEYRLGVALVMGVVHAPLVFLERVKPAPLARVLFVGLRVVFVFQAGLLAVGELRRAELITGLVGGDLETLLVVVLNVLLAVSALGLVALKQEVLTLIGEGKKRSMTARLRRVLDRYYRGVLGLSVVLFLMWAVGYTKAASFVLIRGYAILSLVALAGTIQRRLDLWERHRRAQLSGARRERVRSIHRMMSLALYSATAVGVLSLLNLRELVVGLLDYPLLIIGTARLSMWNLGRAALWMMGFVVFSRMVRPALERSVYPRLGMDVSVAYAANTVLHYLLMGIGLGAALTALRIDFSALLVVAGALGVGIGLGLQSITHNLVSGFILLLGRSVKKGDTVQVDEHYGTVEAVGARSVTLMTPDHQEVVIPSSRLVSQAIVNYSHTSPLVRVHIPVGVHYNSDVRHVEQALLHAARRHKAVLLDPPPQAWLVSFGSSSVDFELLVWIDSRRTYIPRLKGELNFHIWDALKEQQIEIPYPQQDLHVKSDPAIHELVSALRGEPAPEPPKRPEPPPMTTIPSYLSRARVRPKLLDKKRQEEVIQRLAQQLGPAMAQAERAESIDPKNRAKRAQELREATVRFFSNRTASLEKMARAHAQALEAYALDQDDESPIDAWLDEAIARATDAQLEAIRVAVMGEDEQEDALTDDADDMPSAR